jgi:hypothetical protein
VPAIFYDELNRYAVTGAQGAEGEQGVPEEKKRDQTEIWLLAATKFRISGDRK